MYLNPVTLKTYNYKTGTYTHIDTFRYLHIQLVINLSNYSPENVIPHD